MDSPEKAQLRAVNNEVANLRQNANPPNRSLCRQQDVPANARLLTYRLLKSKVNEVGTGKIDRASFDIGGSDNTESGGSKL